jgi:hypothetical protein
MEAAKQFLEENMIPHTFLSGIEHSNNIWECMVLVPDHPTPVRVAVYLNDQDFKVEDY